MKNNFANMSTFASAILLATMGLPVLANPTTPATDVPEKSSIGTVIDSVVQKAKENPLGIRGYVQFRTAQNVGGDEGFDLWSDRSLGDDKSIDKDNNFIIRRGRLVFSRDVSENLSIYIQPDFGSSAGTTGNVLQLRDAYADVFVDKAHVHRFRVGQSKVPYGWENMQSSQNRLGLDRADALNSAVRDERDLGVFYYYTPTFAQDIYKEIDSKKLKHSGNYGMFAFGAYNGQGANRNDQNENLHLVTRFNYPIKTKAGQFYEFGIQAYDGDYVSSTGAYRNASNVSVTPTCTDYRGVTSACGSSRGATDRRVAVSAIMYPQPFGLQAEYNIGETPGLDTATNTIAAQNLKGGYVQAMYKIDDKGYGVMIPFVRYQYYDGYNKAETNSPRNKVNDVELGLEWQIKPGVELTTVYHKLNRNNLVTGNRAGIADYGRFDTDYVRVQLQLSY